MKNPKSIRAKLLNVSKQSGIDFQSVITRYFHERLLYRISISEYNDHFVLKGGNLMYAIYGLDSRPTTDIDLEGLKVNNLSGELDSIFKSIVDVVVDDGVIFDLESIEAAAIQENNNYQGVRIICQVQLDTIKQNIQIDIGFGDVITPNPIQMGFPKLLEETEEAKVWTYTIETVIAEKLQAMLVLAQLNSRMKDYFDVYTLIQSGKIDYVILKEAVKRTFSQRETPLNFDSVIFQEEFITDKNRLKMWNTFLRKIKVEQLDFSIVMKEIENMVAKIQD